MLKCVTLLYNAIYSNPVEASAQMTSRLIHSLCSVTPPSQPWQRICTTRSHRRQRVLCRPLRSSLRTSMGIELGSRPHLDVLLISLGVTALAGLPAQVQHYIHSQYCSAMNEESDYLQDCPSPDSHHRPCERVAPQDDNGDGEDHREDPEGFDLEDFIDEERGRRHGTDWEGERPAVIRNERGFNDCYGEGLTIPC